MIQLFLFFTFHSFLPLFFFISTVKTLHSWPCGIVSLLTLSNQLINSSNNDQISFGSDFDRFWKEENLHLITPTRKHLNPQKDPVLIFHRGEESCETRLPLTFQYDNNPTNHTSNFYFLFSKKRRKWLARAWMWKKKQLGAVCVLYLSLQGVSYWLFPATHIQRSLSHSPVPQ